MRLIIWGEAPVRGRKRNSNKNRTYWAKTSSMRNRPRTGEDFSELQKGRFNWKKEQ